MAGSRNALVSAFPIVRFPVFSPFFPAAIKIEKENGIGPLFLAGAIVLQYKGPL